MILAKDKTVEELITVMVEHDLEIRASTWTDGEVVMRGLPLLSDKRAAILRAMGLPKDKWHGNSARYYERSKFPEGFVEAALLLTELKITKQTQ